MIVLDTHAWLWWVAQPKELSPKARAAIEGADVVGVSTLSVWEVTMLARRGRISLDRDIAVWIRQALGQDRVKPLPPTAEVAIAAGTLHADDFPGGPADRIIYATAKTFRAPLVTRDRAIRRFDARDTVW